MTDGIFLYLCYNLFLYLIELLRTSESQGFLLEYFFLISIFGKHFSCNEISLEWKRSKDSRVSGMLPISVQSTSEIACVKFCLFFSLFTRVTKHESVSSTVNEQLTWKIGKWSEITATRMPFNEQFRSSWLLVNILAISVADVEVIIVGREISWRNSLQYIKSTNSFVRSCDSEFSRSIL